MIHVVKNLRKLRLRMGVSQQQLADVIGTSQQSINHDAALVRDYRTLSKEEKSSILLVQKNYLRNRKKPPEP